MGQVIARRKLSPDLTTLTLLVIFIQRLGAVPVLTPNTHNLASSLAHPPTAIRATVNNLAPAATPLLGSAYYNHTDVPVSDPLAPLTATLTHLVEGLAYHVRVSAWNGAGNAFGAAQPSWPVLLTASTTPRAVGEVTLTPTSDKSLRVGWKAPASAGQGGLPATAYTVEYDLSPPTHEVQVVGLNASSAQLSGTFCVSYGGYSTSAIPYDASASRLESAIESLAGVGRVLVTQSLTQSANRYGIAWTITFLDNVGPLPLLAISCNDLVGSMVVINTYRVAAAPAPAFTAGSVGIFQRPLGSLTIAETPTVLNIQANATAGDLNGYFQVVNAGEASGPIDVYTTADQLKAILENMLTVSAVSVAVTDHSMQTGARQDNYGRTWQVTFYGRSSVAAVSPFAGQYRSLMVTTGYGYNSSQAVVAAGGTLYGSGSMVGVARVAAGGVPVSVEVGGLVAGQAYVARVAAANTHLTAPPVTAAVASGPKTSPPSPPRSVRVAVVSDTQVAVWWDPPALTGGAPVTGYSVQWDVSTQFGPSSSSAQATRGDTFLVVPALTPGALYTIRVAAYNSQGYSPFAAALPSLGGWAELQSVHILSASTFTLRYTDQGGAFQDTVPLPAYANAWQVMDALQNIAGRSDQMR